MKRYRTERGYFPQDMRAFEYFSDYAGAAMQSMRKNGFKNLYISYLYLDSLVIDFWHEPVYEQLPGQSKYGVDLSGQLIYMRSDTNFYEYRRFNKSLPGAPVTITLAIRPITGGVEQKFLNCGHDTLHCHS
ncbi:hypothetical protein ACFOTA_13770 [Chitinophaga sp. GCM10012297]|uniref:Uncharacterized protein n=1 Tax=Chitinophaga chungangae TaxID=2821488 RepID=A0ABS3YF29_9BACT|nr:hypothetical protein [Chitinophaga chungangae]MBO9153284.1 hypothetical protein [Chitinophaga chungangae]